MGRKTPRYVGVKRKSKYNYGHLLKMSRKRAVEGEGDPHSWRKTTNRYCAVWGCLSNSRRNGDLSYFSLPQDPERAQAWLDKIQREMPSNSQSMRVCEKHFEPRMVGNNKSRKRLMMDAVPTLLLPDPNCSRSYPMEFLSIEMAANKSGDSEDDMPIATLKQERVDIEFDQDIDDSVSDNQDNPEQVKADVSRANGAVDESMDHDIGDGGEGGGSGGRSDVGRMVDCSQADDRKMIRLVRERRLLYARNNMPVASYYSRVKGLWNEVAHEMGWTVADVRRKWSHIRNSYSRHLRNEMHGARTGKGRMVSRWYLADELEFLREHMATDITAYNPTMEKKPDEPEDVTNKPLPSMSEHTEVQDAVASTLATPFAQPIITASKSKAHKQRGRRLSQRTRRHSWTWSRLSSLRSRWTSNRSSTALGSSAPRRRTTSGTPPTTTAAHRPSTLTRTRPTSNSSAAYTTTTRTCLQRSSGSSNGDAWTSCTSCWTRMTSQRRWCVRMTL